MAFLRAKKRGDKIYYYIVEAYRKDGKPRQRVLKYIGTKKPSSEELDRIMREVKGNERPSVFHEQ